MKYKSLLFFMIMGLFVAFAACDDDDKPTSTHTDASLLVGGSFAGTLVNPSTEEVFCDDAVISLTRIDDVENVQAMTLRFQSASKGLDIDAVVNVAVAGDEFSFSSGLLYPKLAGRLVGERLSFVIPLNRSGSAFSNAATCISYEFEGTKVSE